MIYSNIIAIRLTEDPLVMVNLYGDARMSVSDGCGIDVASQRADDLDLIAVDRILSLIESGNKNVRALDVGCGLGGQSLRMARAGAFVTAVDVGDFGGAIFALAEECGVSERMSYIRGDIMDLSGFFVNTSFDVIVAQRMIHYFNYSDACAISSSLRLLLSDGGRLFVSASGIDSELGDGYGHKSVPLAERFSRLSDEMASKHSITHPVCLYSAEDMISMLESSGLFVEHVFVSPFGNIKAVARAYPGNGFDL